MSEYIFPEAVVMNLADPFVLTASDGMFYMYGTSTNRGGGFRVYSSNDLENWEPRGMAFSNRRENWAFTDFWAPEVVERDGRFYMFYTARQRETNSLRIGLAVSDSPLGPFIDERGVPLLDVEWANIDAHVLFCQEGRIWMYFARDCSENFIGGLNRSDIYVVELDQNFEQLREPIYLFSPSQDWETLGIMQGWLWNEGPSVIYVDGLYYMTYSGNPYFAFEYAIGVATAERPYGPWTKYANNPVLQGCREQDISGTGHNSIFRSHDGRRTFIAYHVHINPDIGGGHRKTLISEVEFANGTMRLIHRH